MKTLIRKTCTGTIEYKVTTYKRSPRLLAPMILLINYPYLLLILFLLFLIYKKKVVDSVVLIPKLGIVINGKLHTESSLPCLNEVQVNWSFRVILFVHSKKDASSSCTILFPVIYYLTIEYFSFPSILVKSIS
jgi:hypothetical protein